MGVCFVAGGSGSKFFNLTKGIENLTTPQHRTHCTPPPHNSSKHDKHPVPQYLLPSISRLTKLLDLHPRGNHERYKTRLISSLQTRAPFSRNPTRLAIDSSLRTRADPRGPFANVSTPPMGPHVNQPSNQPTNHPTVQPTNQHACLGTRRCTWSAPP